jgi:hypothetical protein
MNSLTTNSKGWWCGAVVLLLTLYALNAGAYSVLTHQELIDLAWNDSIRPLLLAKFPGASEEQLRVAHAYAYGGCAIQDMGYYPFGKKFFSDLTHYVRSGDFVAWLFRNAKTMDEYAFAIGALSHYLGDSIGHSEAINPATSLAFPKLHRKFGPIITYDQSPHGHIRTEFAFDVNGLANQDFAPLSYLKFIGFRVPRRFLAQAFINTYGFNIHEVLGRARPALRSYRTAVRSFIPSFADAEVVLHGNDFPTPPDDEVFREFIEQVARTNYERKWNHKNDGPGFRAHLLAIVVFLVPKIGAASDLAIKIPTQQTQGWYLQSVNHTVDEFRRLLRQLGTDSALRLTNIDLDTGDRVKLRDYPRADQAYARLLERVTSKPGDPIPVDLQRDVLNYYANLSPTVKSEKRLQPLLTVLRGMKTVNGLEATGTQQE